MFRILNNFSYLDNTFIIEAFKACQLAFSAWKEVNWCLEVGFLCLEHLLNMFRILNNFSYIDN